VRPTLSAQTNDIRRRLKPPLTLTDFVGGGYCVDISSVSTFVPCRNFPESRAAPHTCLRPYVDPGPATRTESGLSVQMGPQCLPLRHG